MSTKQKDSEQLDPGSGNVEQIREILFGGHIRAFDERFDLVEARLAKESDALRKAIEKRVLELERLLGDYRDEADERMGAEASNRDLALNKLELALAQARMDNENQLAAMEDQIKEEFKQVRADMKTLRRELTTTINRADKSQQKRADKVALDAVARKDLAGLFTDLAKSLQPGKSTGRK